MEKSRSWFQQVIGHKMLFVAFLLFATDILPEVVAITNDTTLTNATASVNISNTPFPASSKMATTISMTSAIPNATMPGNLNRSLIISEQPAQSFQATPPVSKQELQNATTVSTAAPEDTHSFMPSKVIASTEEKHPFIATEVQESKLPPVQEEVPSKMTVTAHFDSEAVSSSTKDLETRSQGSFVEQAANTIAYLGTTTSTESKEDRERSMPPDQVVPVLTQSPETSSHYISGPSTTWVISTSSAEISDSFGKRSSEKKHTVIILAVVFTILLVIGLLAFLCLRRRHHSGSTSFNSPEWAGQATLPDDTGLDKDVEQQVGSVGEGETRRGTLVTFFGKRQSRVPSIAMEDINGKGGKEETEQLLGREAEIGSPSEVIGDANGKVPEPLKGSSQ